LNKPIKSLLATRSDHLHLASSFAEENTKILEISFGLLPLGFQYNLLHSNKSSVPDIFIFFNIYQLDINSWFYLPDIEIPSKNRADFEEPEPRSPSQFS